MNAAQQKLVDDNLPLVKTVAMQIVQRLPRSVSVDDLEQDGVIGLIQAAENFDPSFGHAFTTHAVARIRGAILDAIRERDPISRDTRQRERQRIAAETQLGADASPAAVCELLGWDEKQYRTSCPPGIDSLFKVLASDGRDATLLDEQIGATTPHPVDELDRAREILRGLSIEEQIVVYLYFWKSKTLAEIGHVLDLSASRVGQIKMIVQRRLERAGRDAFVERASG